MVLESISRGEILKSLGVGAFAGSVLRIIPADAAEHAHRMVMEEKKRASGAYAPKFFSAQQYKTLQALCQTSIPADPEDGEAVVAATPTCIDRPPITNTEKEVYL